MIFVKGAVNTARLYERYSGLMKLKYIPFILVACLMPFEASACCGLGVDLGWFGYIIYAVMSLVLLIPFFVLAIFTTYKIVKRVGSKWLWLLAPVILCTYVLTVFVILSGLNIIPL